MELRVILFTDYSDDSSRQTKIVGKFKKQQAFSIVNKLYSGKIRQISKRIKISMNLLNG